MTILIQYPHRSDINQMGSKMHDKMQRTSET